ncbi:MAG: hypothetical protein CMF58_06520 [Lentimicrobiaceae bacterium]|nr:hypothetical protein [Lentimicrobiaceae bacterium]
MGQGNADNNRDTVRKQMSQNLREQYVCQFQKAMEQDVDIPYNAKTLYLRESLIEEEFKELSAEIQDAIAELEHGGEVTKATQEKILKELCDLLYVVSGFAVTFGLPVQPAFNRVHESNMSKLEEGRPIYSEWGKVLKGKNYKPPTLGDLL